VQKLRRILIDCSFVDFLRQPTGIPRVVIKYIEIGYAWGQQNNVEIVPVTPSADGLYICRPVPGHGAPRSLLVAAATVSEPRDIAADIGNAVNDLLGLAAIRLLGTVPQRLGHEEAPRVAPDGSSSASLITPTEGPLTRTARVECGPGDLIFCPGYWHDVSPELYRGYAAAGAKIIILVHDILPIIFPRFYNAPWCYDFRRNVKAAFSFADAFCAVSDYTRRCLNELRIRERLRKIPIMTTFNGFEPLVSESMLQRLSGPRYLPDSPAMEVIRGLDRYYLMVGSIEPKKGHRPVIECFEDMWHAGLGSDLVIIGRRGWLEQDAIQAIEESPFYQSNLFWFSDLDDSELGSVYLGARALVFASAGEGFGIPMIEAAEYGTPVVAYDTPIVREILGGAARTFADAPGFVERIVEMEQDEPHAAAAADVRAVAWPSWEDYTPRVLDALRAFFEVESRLPERVSVR
jgi:glycosyltransferase involved in cell wall biosynthesis